MPKSQGTVQTSTCLDFDGMGVIEIEMTAKRLDGSPKESGQNVFPKRGLNSQSGGGPLVKSFLNKPCYMIVAKHRFECFSL